MTRLSLIALVLVVCFATAGENPGVRRCGCCNATVASRGVFDGGGKAPRWVSNPSEITSPPTQKTVVTYSFVTQRERVVTLDLDPIVDSDFIGAETRDTIKRGVEAWYQAAGIKLVFVESGGQIRIGSGGDMNVLGYATYDTSSPNNTDFYMTVGCIQLTRNNGWTKEILYGTAVHELGHAIGLGHTNVLTAVMHTDSGPNDITDDDYWYAQFLYGPAPARVRAVTNPTPAAPQLLIGRASVKQTGTNSDPSFQQGLTGANGPGTGTGAVTKNNVLRYVLERKAPGETAFSVLIADLQAPTTQNSDDALTIAENEFPYTDSTATTEGTYQYRVKAVRENSGDDIYSDALTVVVGSGALPDPNPTPSPTGAVTVSKLQMKPVFSQQFHDSYQLQGTLPLAADFNPDGLTAKVNVGGVEGSFDLDFRGSGFNDNGSIKMKLQKGVWKFQVAQKFGDFAASWEDEGLVDGTVSMSVNMPVSVEIGGSLYTATKGLFYKGKEGKGGTAK